MILPTIQHYISNLPCITFDQYFMKYVLDVHDANIDMEFDFLLRHNTLDEYSLHRLVDEEHGSLRSL